MQENYKFSKTQEVKMKAGEAAQHSTPALPISCFFPFGWIALPPLAVRWWQCLSWGFVGAQWAQVQTGHRKGLAYKQCSLTASGRRVGLRKIRRRKGTTSMHRSQAGLSASSCLILQMAQEPWLWPHPNKELGGRSWCPTQVSEL